MARSQKPRRKYDPNRWLSRTINANNRRIDANPLTDGQQNKPKEIS